MASTRKLDPKDPNSKWVCEYTDANGKRRRYTPKTGLKKDADTFKRKVEAELERGEHVADAATLTFETAARLWLEDCEKRHKALGSPVRSTINGFETLLKCAILPVFGKTMMTKLKGEDIQDWLNDRSSTNAHDTLRQFRLIISLIIKFCIATDRLKRNVLTDKQVRIPGEKKRIGIPSREQISRLLAAMNQRAKSEQMLSFLQRRAFITLALFGGLRAGEICALQWENIDLDKDDCIRVRESFSAINGLKSPKTRAGVRDVPMVDLVRGALRDLKAYYGQNATGFVFVTKNGVNMRSSFDVIIWRPVLRKAGLAEPAKKYPLNGSHSYKPGKPDFHFHSLRHASVSLLISEGVNSLHVASFAGHANVNTTMGIYGHLFPEDSKVRTTLDVVSKAFPTDWTTPRPVNH